MSREFGFRALAVLGLGLIVWLLGLAALGPPPGATATDLLGIDLPASAREERLAIQRRGFGRAEPTSASRSTLRTSHLCSQTRPSSRRSRPAIHLLLDGLEPEALIRPGACGADWSVKDVLNHLAAWQEAALRVVGDLRAGRWGRLGPSVERFNREQHTADRDRPLDEALQRLQSARAALMELLAQLDEAALLNEYGRQAVGWWAKWATYGHYEQQLGDLETFARPAQG